MSKDIFEIINPTNTLGVCRPLAHILGTCETIVYNALLSKYRYYQKNDMLDDGWLYHIRFIAVSDNFDSAELNGDTGGVDMAFKYLINECYSRDMSMKSKSAKLARCKRGEYQSVVCPYGYQKGEDGRMKPDEETADNVRQIFQWAAEGLSAGAISRKLSEMKILTPAEYKASKGKTTTIFQGQMVCGVGLLFCEF